jgi:hypothetical protein
MTEVETMSGARLDDVIAYRADFSRANITGKERGRVCIEHAFLEEAKCRCAVLRGVDLRDADLQDADFTNAQLLGTDLRGAKLNGAIVAGADLSRADLRGVDLTQVVGKPSSIAGALVDEETRLPWPDNTTIMQHDFLGLRRRFSALGECRTVRSSNDEIGRIVENAPIEPLEQLRNACSPRSDLYSDSSARGISRQQSVPLEPARIEIVSEPAGADVTLEGTFVGITPVSVHRLNERFGLLSPIEAGIRKTETDLRILIGCPDTNPSNWIRGLRAGGARTGHPSWCGVCAGSA